MMQSILAVLRQAFFFEVGEGEFKPRWRLIGLAGAALVLALVSVYLWVDVTQPPAGGANLGTVLYLKCTNPECGHVAHLTVQQIQQMVQDPVPWEALIIKCPECGQQTLTQAYQCPHCQEVFVISLIRPGSDKCPDCGLSYSSAPPKE